MTRPTPFRRSSNLASAIDRKSHPAGKISDLQPSCWSVGSLTMMGQLLVIGLLSTKVKRDSSSSSGFLGFRQTLTVHRQWHESISKSLQMIIEVEQNWWSPNWLHWIRMNPFIIFYYNISERQPNMVCRERSWHRKNMASSPEKLIQVPGLETFLRALPTKHFTALSYSLAQDGRGISCCHFWWDLFLVSLSYIDGFRRQGSVEALWSCVWQGELESMVGNCSLSWIWAYHVLLLHWDSQAERRHGVTCNKQLARVLINNWGWKKRSMSMQLKLRACSTRLASQDPKVMAVRGGHVSPFPVLH